MQTTYNIETALLNEVTCALCHDIFEKPFALVPCLHIFCLDCVSRIPKQSDYYETPSCPICRTPSHNQVANFTMQNFIDIYKTTDSYKKLKQRQQIVINKQAANIAVPEPEVQMLEVLGTRMNPCRSYAPGNSTGYQCSHPISDENQTETGHLLCGYCFEYMPSKGENINAPAINYCCSFCGVVACNEYWYCRDTSPIVTLHKLREITQIPDWLRKIESIRDLGRWTFKSC